MFSVHKKARIRNQKDNFKDDKNYSFYNSSRKNERRVKNLTFSP